MDWQKVKLILIIALLATNMIISFFIFQKQSDQSNVYIEEKMSVIMKIMADKGVINVIENPPTAQSIPTVDLQSESYDLTKLAKIIIGENYREEGGSYFGGGYEIRLVDNGRVLYMKSNQKSDELPPLTLEIAKRTAERFIVDDLGFMNDFFFKDYEIEEKFIKLNYIQRYHEFFIDNTNMTVVIGSSGVESFDRHWHIIKGEQDDTMAIIKYEDALFKAFDLIEKEGFDKPLEIKSVRLGYGLKTSILGADIKSGEALPYYRFFLSNGKHVTVPALQVE